MKDSIEINHRLIDGTKTLGIELTTLQTEQLLALIQLLTKWNSAYNLTAVRNSLDMVGYHLLDSIALAPYLGEGVILDVGTGAGFPGLPLSIIYPQRNFSLLDSNGKKIRFVRQAVMELGLNNVEVIHSRIETYQNKGKFATIVARALAALPLLLRWVTPLLQRPGVLLAPKSREVQTELTDVIPKLDPNQILVHRLEVPYLVGERILVEIRFP